MGHRSRYPGRSIHPLGMMARDHLHSEVLIDDQERIVPMRHQFRRCVQDHARSFIVAADIAEPPRT